MSNRIEILDNNTVEIFAEGSDVPFLRQPTWPNQAPWANAGEARTWAEMYVEAMEVADAPYAPNGPGEERQAKPTAEEIAAYQAELEAQNTPPA
jgi:hypothetical protein